MTVTNQGNFLAQTNNERKQYLRRTIHEFTVSKLLFSCRKHFEHLEEFEGVI